MVNNTSGGQVMGTARIFMSPKFDERGTEMQFRDQRKLMIEMDKFVVACKLMLLKLWNFNKSNFNSFLCKNLQ